MADTKISALTSATTPLAGTEVLPIVQSSTTKKVTVSDLTANRTVLASGLGVNNNSPADYVEVSGSGANGIRISRTGTLTQYITLSSGSTGPSIDGSSGIGEVSIGVNGSRKLVVANSGDATLNNGNLIQGTAAKGVTTSGSFALGLGTNGSTSQVTINSDSSVSAITGSFNNVGTAQTITINDTNGGYVVITGVQGGVGSSTWTLPFVKRSGSLAIGTASKAILTADPISSVTVSSNNISVTPLAANTYITFAIYYTPLGA